MNVIAGDMVTCYFTNTKTNPDLTISKITPDKILAGSPDTTVAITGTKFNSDSSVSIIDPINSTSKILTSKFLSTTKLEVIIPKEFFSKPNKFWDLVVTNKTQDGAREESNAGFIDIPPTAINPNTP